MTRLHVPVCEDCGWSGKGTTEALAAFSLRKHRCSRYRETLARIERVAAREAADGPKRDCRCPVARHQHGTNAAYVVDKCRCRACRDANTAYESMRNRRAAYGRWEPYVDAEPAREHVQALRRDGLGLKTIAARSGAPHGALSKLMYGQDGRPPSRRIRKATADAILAVTPGQLADGAKIPALGTHRRLQALVAAGWSQSQLATRLGVDRGNFGLMMRRDRVRVATARAVRELYAELARQAPPESNHRERSAASRARNHAKAHGWPGPAAWIDIDMDDPDAVPDVIHLQPTRRNRDDLIEDVEWMVRDGVLLAVAARRLGIAPASLEQALRLAGRRDLVQRLKHGEAVAS